MKLLINFQTFKLSSFKIFILVTILLYSEISLQHCRRWTCRVLCSRDQLQLEHRYKYVNVVFPQTRDRHRNNSEMYFQLFNEQFPQYKKKHSSSGCSRDGTIDYIMKYHKSSVPHRALTRLVKRYSLNCPASTPPPLLAARENWWLRSVEITCIVVTLQ